MKTWICITLSILALFSTTAHAAILPGEPLPQTRSIYLRGLAGASFYTGLGDQTGNAVGFDWGGELGFTVLQMEPNAEFSSMALGIHYDTTTLDSEVFTGRQTSILGQFLFVNTNEVGGYFGPEAGMRMVSDSNSGASVSSMAAGFIAGINIALTTNLTYGPQFEAVYAFPVQLDGMEDKAVMCRAHLAISYYF